MVVQADQPPAELDRDTLTPLCDEAEFAQEINALVADEAPRLFAVVQEYGERVDGWIAAWGMAFENCAKVIGVIAHVVWVNPAAPTRPEDDEAAS